LRAMGFGSGCMHHGVGLAGFKGWFGIRHGY
jgi:hypothetical protein